MPEKITINDVEIPLEEFEVKRGDKKGEKYFAPDSSVGVSTLLEAWGEEKIMDAILGPKIKQMFKNWTREATSDEGFLDFDQLVQMASAMSARGEPLKVIQERILEVIAKLTKPNLAPEELQHLVQKLSKLREDAMNKRRKTDDDDDDEVASAAPVTV